VTDNFERMDEFFDKRATSYDNHMQVNVNDFENFYNKIAEPIKRTDEKISILDIGCGTGLELEYVFKKAPRANITCLDLSEKMLTKLEEKFEDKKAQIETRVGSYLDNNLGTKQYDYIISVMTVHHLKYGKKLKLYKNIKKALKNGGRYIEGDYVVSRQKEKKLLKEYEIKTASLEGADQGNYHIDIPFSLKTQKKLFIKTGFKDFHLIYKKGEAAIYVMQN